MDILPYGQELLPALAAAYNAAIGGVPHCYPVSDDEFVSALAGVSDEGRSPDRLHSEAVFIARQKDLLLGFVHVATERPKDAKGADQGIIRFLWYERGQRPAGQALLNVAHDYCRQRDLTEIKAFPQNCRYPFYHFANAFLSVHLDHVQALLRFNGYEFFAGEVFLDWLDYEPVEPTPADVAAEFTVQWKEGRGKRPGVEIQALQGERKVGTCGCVSGGEYSRADEAHDWLFVLWLGVEENLQGKGLGRYLLQRALQEMHGIGYRHASISTGGGNHRAFLFYSNYGFRVVDWTYGLERDLKEK